MGGSVNGRGMVRSPLTPAPLPTAGGRASGTPPAASLPALPGAANGETAAATAAAAARLPAADGGRVPAGRGGTAPAADERPTVNVEDAGRGRFVDRPCDADVPSRPAGARSRSRSRTTGEPPTAGGAHRGDRPAASRVPMRGRLAPAPDMRAMGDPAPLRAAGPPAPPPPSPPPPPPTPTLPLAAPRPGGGDRAGPNAAPAATLLCAPL
ncbi:hypothetical protein BU14_1196s0003 [Porphyra umbilicalis]|uniref:Uncharacterized protein n=1 Tax=Porphyra umbilicalis TaxID=2786 RepID=A0A1X6NME3_PORUM|nr:hypothetical protein BU14_1196s0003 [Porphyra umbilicalis]|eukprot:OSX69755.1 hypothetical protein BU14_1196s0003 [Porphyra umbilicalis]